MSALVLLLVLLVAWLTAAATAVRTVSRIWLRHWVDRKLTGSASAGVYLERPQRLLLASGTVIAALTFTIGAVVSAQVQSGMALMRALVGAVLLLLVVGQLLPRVIARRWGVALVPVLLPALHALGAVVSPLLWLAERAARALAGPASPAPDGPREALEDLLREGELEGVGDTAESAIISGVAEFGATRVRDVMTPREAIVAVERSLPADAMARLIAGAAFSRIPVVDGDLDHVAGMIHSFDVLEHPQAPAARLRRVMYASPDLPCLDLMRSMLLERRHLAIVRDANGRTLGLATLDDLVEELVGDIHDEFPDASPQAKG